MKIKIKYNPKIVKKVILWVILVALVAWFGITVGKSYKSGHITSNSKMLSSDIPSGDYQDYLKIVSNVTNDVTRLDKFDLYEDCWQRLKFPKLSENVYIDGTTGVASNDSSDFDKDYTYTDGTTTRKGYYTSDNGTVTWTFNVEEEGMYCVYIEYYLPEGGGSNAERAIKINGTSPFSSLDTVTFYRTWKDKESIKQDINGNDLKPAQKEIFSARSMYLADDTGYVSDPYLLYFVKGENSISFESLRENLVIFNIQLTAMVTTSTYEEYIEEHKDAEKVMNFHEEIQAQDSIERSSPTLYATADRTSPINTPNDPVKTKYNTIGGSRWSTPGDWISWEVEVPKAGLYQISFRAKQDLARGLYTARRVLVNGNVPFKEANNARFYYGSDYSIVTIGDENGEAYYFYLEEGKNTISLQATIGDYGELISTVEEVLDDLNSLYLRIIARTTANPDKYQEYNLYGDNPSIANDSKGRNMVKIFSDSAKKLNDVSETITQLTGEKSSLNNSLDKIVIQIGDTVEKNGKTTKLNGFASKPWNVTKDLSEFKNNLSALGTWILDIQDQSLTIERLWVHSDDYKLPNANANWFKNFWFDARGFVLSFFFDYQSIGVTSTEGFKKEIEVWYLTSDSTGREQANSVKNLIDSTFIPDTNINVILKVLAPSVLLPATLAGIGPDVAINVDGGLPVNYALRGAVYDVSQQKDFHEVTGICTPENEAKGYCTRNSSNYTESSSFDYPENARFQYSSMVPLYLETTDGGGYYGLPNTAAFNVMFYRTDIFEANNWTVPKTWEDVKSLVTELQVSNLDFYMPLEGAGSTIYSILLYQRGGKYYQDDYKASAFDTEIGMQAFEDWCSYFTDYSFALSANFTNRFRTGEMPIGIASYTLFNTLTVFAPDITGKWSFAPLPGTYREVVNADGTTTTVLDNRGVASGTANIIMQQSDDYDSSWEFLKWWTSRDIQYNYARELESILGAAARHNTANIEAFKLLPWSKEERDILMSQWDIAFGIPEIAGGYYVGRNLENAIRAVINNDKNPRETLSEYVTLINGEITRKRKEFGLATN